MKNFFTAILLSVSLVACSSESIPVSKAIELKPGLIIGDPLDCGIPNLLIFPIGSSYKPEIHNKPVSIGITNANASSLSWTANTGTGNLYKVDRYAAVEYTNGKADDFDISNILFYDMTTGKSYPLHTDSLHILSFAIHKEFNNPLIFYRVVKNDINKDKRFNSVDPIMLYVSRLNGDSLTQITPSNEQFIDYTYYPETQMILAKTIIDADSSLTFDTTDETNFLELKLNAPAYGREIFEKSIKDLLKQRMGIKQ
jgi:hypothetical protein